jgi:hypothetical protein
MLGLQQFKWPDNTYNTFNYVDSSRMMKHILYYNVAGLLAHRDGWPFDRPITKADAPDYHKIIAKPMDLCTIR